MRREIRLTKMSVCLGMAALLQPRTSWCLQHRHNHVNFVVKASSHSTSSLSGLDSAIKGYIFGENKATEVAHLLWKQVVKKGDIVVDATCGNGYDTLALAKLAIDDTAQAGCVYAFDLQQDAINTTSHLIQSSLNPLQTNSVKLFLSCHTKMAQLLPHNTSPRLVSFNLGYLPGGDKKIITKSDTTLQALKTAKELLLPGGVISVVAYVGHPGGRDEYEIVQGFASGLPPETWSCSQIQMLNKPSAPILLFLFKR